MQPQLPVVLTIHDYTLLEHAVHGPAEPFPGGRAFISEKLSRASIVPLADLPADVVMLRSRVRYRVGSSLPQDRTIVSGPDETIDGSTLLLTSRHGAALIGARLGQAVAALCSDGSTELLRILSVRHASSASRPKLSLVSSREPSPVLATVRQFHGDDDDPGPSAA